MSSPYQRGNALNKRELRDVSSKMARRVAFQTEDQFSSAVKAAATTDDIVNYAGARGRLSVADGRTYKATQAAVIAASELQTQEKAAFELSNLSLGPYTAKYSRDGTHALIAGARGHVSLMEWAKFKPLCELQVGEGIKDACFLHNHSMFAVAQKKHTFIYDSQGVELHCLRQHLSVNRLEFLPYHFLLASIGSQGLLRYQDTSTGAMVATIPTKLGPSDCLTQDPATAVIYAGHSRGHITLWTPNMDTPAVKMLGHKGSVLSMGVSGNKMASSGADGQIKIWDIRKTFEAVSSFYTLKPATSMSISQTGLLGLACGPRVQVFPETVWEGVTGKPYLTNLYSGEMVKSLAFCPWNDFLGVGRTKGFSTMVVPGAGEAGFDAFETNPYESKKQRGEREVHMLLEKLQPDMISLETDLIGKVAANRDIPTRSEGTRRHRKGERENAKYKRRKGMGITDSMTAKVEKNKRNKADRVQQGEESVLDRFAPRR